MKRLLSTLLLVVYSFPLNAIAQTTTGAQIKRVEPGQPPTDLAKFAIELQLSLAGKSNKVLTKQSVDMMTTSYKDDVGLGFFIERHGNALYFGHGGADEGFRAELVVSRDKNYGLAVMVKYCERLFVVLHVSMIGTSFCRRRMKSFR